MLRRGWPDWALLAYAWVLIAAGIGLAQWLATGSPLNGVVGGAVFATSGTVLVALALRRTAGMDPAEGARARATLPFSLLCGVVAGSIVMGVLTWLFDRT